MRGWELEDAFQPHVSEDDAKANGVSNAFKVRIRNSTMWGFARVWDIRMCKKWITHKTQIYVSLIHIVASAFKWSILVMLMETKEVIFPARAHVDLSNCGNLKCQKCQKEDTFQSQLSLDRC